MDIFELIKELEKRLPEMLVKLGSSNPKLRSEAKDWFGIHLQYAEFLVPKIQRSTFEPSTDNKIEVIITKDYDED